MPRGNPAIRVKAQELYLQGVALDAIAKSLDVPSATVRKWKERGQWDMPAVTYPSPSKSSLPDVMRETVERIGNKALAISERVMTKAGAMAITGPNDAAKIASAVSTSYVTCRKALGLEGNTVSLHFHLGGGRREQRCALRETVVDVEPLPSPEPSSEE